MEYSENMLFGEFSRYYRLKKSKNQLGWDVGLDIINLGYNIEIHLRPLKALTGLDVHIFSTLKSSPKSFKSFVATIEIEFENDERMLVSTYMYYTRSQIVEMECGKTLEELLNHFDSSIEEFYKRLKILNIKLL